MTDLQQRIRELEAQVRALEEQNVRLQVETEEVAAANVNAAMQLVELSEARTRELEAKNAQIAEALRTAEEASLQKSRFLANMGHELRTPISGILGLAELLASGPMSRLQREHVESIAATADSFLELINQMLDFAKAEAGRVELECVAFDLWATIESVAQLLQVRADQKNVDLLFELDSRVPRMVVGDPLRLRQVLLNLGTNAVKFTERGIVLLVAEPWTAPDGKVGVDVRFVDTGCGFTPEVGKRLFEPFVQADASTSRRYGGTGLGLAICRHLVECMHGKLWHRSQAGDGTTFGLQLPLTPVPGTEPEPPRRRVVRLLTVRPNTHSMLADHLHHLGCTVLAEDSPGEADLLAVEDTNDPVAAVQAARARHGDAPVLLFSCHGTQVLESELERLGVVGVMARPVRPSRLGPLLDSGHRGGQDPTHADHCHGLRVLVVEDTPVNRRVLVAQLARMGCIVTSAADGVQAYAWFCARDFDLILMDCQMPVVDGYTASRQIREEEARRGKPRTPILALTANADAGNRELCLAAGMDDYCCKPLRIAQLRERLARWAPSR
ncbi:MAG: response regulator [Planctomycetota bacterium]